MTKLETIRNPDLDVLDGLTSEWNTANRRRWGFHHLPQMSRFGTSIRAPRVLTLNKAQDRRIGDLPAVRRMTGYPHFSGVCVLQGQNVLYENYAPDFGPDQPHSMQSITKTCMHFIIGQLVEAGEIDLTKQVSHYIPEIGSGYAAATIQQVLDMDVINNFNEDYSTPYVSDHTTGVPTSYSRQEIAMAWRLPPEGEQPFSMRSFTATLVSDDVTNPTGNCEYRSPNTDLLAWIAETITGRPTRDMLVEIVEAAGIEGVYFIGTDCDNVPVVSGGGAMTARDLARYGQLFARLGKGVNGEKVGSAAFMEETRSGRGTNVADCPHGVRYSNQTYTNGKWFGHPGFAGQFLMAHPETEISIAYFSVLETVDAHDDEIFNDIIGMSQDIIALYAA